jgi:2-methylcitrate dehydratase PrpD
LPDAALQLRREHRVDEQEIEQIELSTFREAKRLFRGMPVSSPVAQYASAFPVAALVRGVLGVAEVSGDALVDPKIRRLLEATSVGENRECSARFPAERLGAVTLVLRDGRKLTSGAVGARGGPENPLSEAEVLAKFRHFAGPALGSQRARALEDAVRRLVEPSAEFADVIHLVCRQ